MNKCEWPNCNRYSCAILHFYAREILGGQVTREQIREVFPEFVRRPPQRKAVDDRFDT